MEHGTVRNDMAWTVDGQSIHDTLANASTWNSAHARGRGRGQILAFWGRGKLGKEFCDVVLIMTVHTRGVPQSMTKIYGAGALAQGQLLTTRGKPKLQHELTNRTDLAPPIGKPLEGGAVESSESESQRWPLQDRSPQAPTSKAHWNFGFARIPTCYSRLVPPPSLKRREPAWPPQEELRRALEEEDEEAGDPGAAPPPLLPSAPLLSRLLRASARGSFRAGEATLLLLSLLSLLSLLLLSL